MADQGRGRPFGLNNERRVPESEERGRGIRTFSQREQSPRTPPNQTSTNTHQHKLNIPSPIYRHTILHLFRVEELMAFVQS